MKSYSPIHVLVDTNLLIELDSYRDTGQSRSEMVREAIRDHITKLESLGSRKNTWVR
ncbi:ribbon-helix-helix protein, CopG family [Roseicyclus mahoneyensis]|jgi:metal-responsive CopG/Arc/MetJ family transcriptional regulator|uniref:ribbon-helix-helix protein, CopG family n=1 Tax=Roseicyclus mahoneyensis TaxID=164332 RepID=UPI000D6C587C